MAARAGLGRGGRGGGRGGFAGSTLLQSGNSMGRGRNDVVSAQPPVTFPVRSKVQEPLLITEGNMCNLDHTVSSSTCWRLYGISLIFIFLVYYDI